MSRTIRKVAHRRAAGSRRMSPYVAPVRPADLDVSCVQVSDRLGMTWDMP